MLSDAPVTANIGVKNMDKAKKFYEDMLGLKPADEQSEVEEGVLYDCGEGTGLYVYRSAFGGTNKATCLYWTVDDIEAEMKDLRAKGVVFEDYDMGTLKTENGLATFGDMQSAWFKDPDGNIMAITTG